MRAAVMLLSICRPCWGLEADQLALVVNVNVPQSRELAEHYAQVRRLPPGRIIELKLPITDDISFQQYERAVSAPVRDFLRQHGLERHVRSLVCFYGVPLRIEGRSLNDDEHRERGLLEAQLADVKAKLTTAVGELEDLARQDDAAFAPPQGQEVADLQRRSSMALAIVARRLSQMDDGPQRQALNQRATHSLELLGGVGALLSHMGRAPTTGEAAARLRELNDKVTAANREIGDLISLRYDAPARARQRELAGEYLGLLGFAEMLQGQLDYLQTADTAAAVDSELALLWWGYYARSRFQRNPLHYSLLGARVPAALMVMRLDAPDAAQVRRIIDDSYAVEQRGLRDQIVLDSRGIPATGPATNAGTYGGYDQSLRDLAALLRQRTRLQLLLDDKPQVLPAGSARDVALYCGWYSLRQYVPCCAFERGAVGYHVASQELLRLHDSRETGWVRGLLNDGVAATMGPVAEPYLVAFPPADDFFPLLLTGKLSLAEVYWRTQPTASWMMSMIGDPLYRPYAATPALAVEDLPARLRGAVAPATEPEAASAPSATAVTTPATPPPVFPEHRPTTVPDSQGAGTNGR